MFSGPLDVVKTVIRLVGGTLIELADWFLNWCAGRRDQSLGV